MLSATSGVCLMLLGAMAGHLLRNGPSFVSALAQFGLLDHKPLWRKQAIPRPRPLPEPASLRWSYASRGSGAPAPAMGEGKTKRVLFVVSEARSSAPS